MLCLFFNTNVGTNIKVKLSVDIDFNCGIVIRVSNTAH